MPSVLISVIGGRPTADQLRSAVEQYIERSPERFSDGEPTEPVDLRASDIAAEIDGVFRKIKADMDSCDCPACQARRARESEEVAQSPEALADRINRFRDALESDIRKDKTLATKLVIAYADSLLT